MLRGWRTHGQGSADAEKTFEIKHVKFLEILLLKTYVSNFYRHIATYISNINAMPSLLAMLKFLPIMLLSIAFKNMLILLYHFKQTDCSIRVYS